MNRRRFLELMGMAAAGSAVVYSFPSIIVPKNIVMPQTLSMWAIPSEYAITMLPPSQYVAFDQHFLKLMYEMVEIVPRYFGRRGVAELEDAGDLKSPAPKGVQVQILSPRPS